MPVPINPGDSPLPVDIANGIYTDGIYTDGIYTDGIYTDGIYTDGIYTDGIYTEKAARSFSLSSNSTRQAILDGNIEGCSQEREIIVR